MSQQFTLDTSSAVILPHNPKRGWGPAHAVRWSDLSPFAQGYVEALFAATRTEEWSDNNWTNGHFARRLGWTYSPAHAGWINPKHLKPMRTAGDWDAYPSDVGGDEVLDIEGLETYAEAAERCALAFSDLHPEALALILRDCERFREVGEREGFECIDNTAEHGRRFWVVRNSRKYGDAYVYARDGFPPLRVYLDDAGKVRLEVAR